MDTTEFIATIKDHPTILKDFLENFRDSLISQLDSLDLDSWNDQDWLIEQIQDLVEGSAQSERAFLKLVGEEVFDAESYLEPD